MPAEQSSATLPLATSTLSSDIGAGDNGTFVSKRWYVVQSQQCAESYAIIHLERHRSLCRGYRKAVRYARRAKGILAPLVLNYLFLRLDAAHDAWRGVNSTWGVARLITQGEMPQPLPYEVVEDLLAQTHSIGVMDWTPTFKIDQAVRIADQLFAGLAGKLDRLDTVGRVWRHGG